MLLLLRRQLPQRKVLADLLRQFLPVALSISVCLRFAAPLPVCIREDGLKVGEEVVMTLPLTQQQPQRVEHILLSLYPILKLTLFYLRVFSHAVDHRYLLFDLFSNQPVVLRKVVNQTFT